jgi:serine protease Do
MTAAANPAPVNPAVNPKDRLSITLGDAFSEVAERLRQSTVQVRAAGNFGGGSGVVWRDDGLIITNAHVAGAIAARAGRQVVELADGRAFDAELVGADPRHDLAALHIEASGLVAADLRRVPLRVGEWVIAVGNPMGVVGAVSTGIIHAASGRKTNWVQADIRLSPGNSGGPLADAEGRVIGINSMIASGLALAVPVHAVQRFLQRASENDWIKIGVTLQPLPTHFGSTLTLGLMIVALEPGGAAHLSGVMVGDIIVAADGDSFSEPADLAHAIASATKPGGLDLTLIRGETVLSCRITFSRDRVAEVA